MWPLKSLESIICIGLLYLRMCSNCEDCRLNFQPCHRDFLNTMGLPLPRFGHFLRIETLCKIFSRREEREDEFPGYRYSLSPFRRSGKRNLRIVNDDDAGHRAGPSDL